MKFRLFFNSVMLAALGAVSAAAQSPNALRVNVPFSFTVNRVALPAGEYSIIQSGSGSRILAMRSDENRRTVLFTGNAAIRSSSAASESSLVFHRSGDSYALADIWWAGEMSGFQLPAVKAGTEPVTSASLSLPEVRVVLAR